MGAKICRQLATVTLDRTGQCGTVCLGFPSGHGNVRTIAHSDYHFSNWNYWLGVDKLSKLARLLACFA
jgi:hypothetical protein